ncbi:hypothetical protein Anas_04384 [Armadillidium nasatum]|uniref:C-type lectin domain-containing protein n=1 Tax=Armadillidium nasatum TaxID=96803 RepID=A0A5N5TNP8_9CRUS|nr:hypothetical protein Anas_04384 [Armadillidium nasatum]
MLLQVQKQLNETTCSKPCPSTATNSTTTTETADLPAISKVTCPYHFENKDGVCLYVQVYPPVSWFDASSLCKSQSSHLVYVREKTFFEKLLKQLNSDRMRVYDFWVGATNHQINGQWSWSDGSYVTSFDVWGLNPNKNKQDIFMNYHKSHQCGFLDGKLFSYLNGASCKAQKDVIIIF